MTDIVNKALVVQEGNGASLAEIQARIYLVRGVQVMLDRDLAVFCMVETGQLNRQVKRHIKRFPEDFMFQLTKEEWGSLKCQIGISNARGGDRRSLPYVFTEQGVSQLSAVLHSDLAEEISVRIIRAFVAMRRFLTANANLFQRVDARYNKQTELDFDKHNSQCAEIKKVQLPNHIHDRYLIVDDDVWLLGASAKDMGHGLCTVIKVGFTPEMVLGMLK